MVRIHPCIKIIWCSRAKWCRYIHLVSMIFVSSLAASVYAQAAGDWVDPSPHKVSFVLVDTDVRLEVLDWGGTGRPLVLLAGGGNTAHVFDDFALQLKNQYHVYGITRRGFGASSYGGSDYAADRLGDDVVAVLDALKLTKPVLVGHSLAGLEMSSVATRYPKRIAGAVYLDAAYAYAFDNGQSPSLSEYQGATPRPPSPGPDDLASFAAFTKWNARTSGFAMPESEFRQNWETSPDGHVGKRRIPQAAGKIMQPGTLKKYAAIPVPALVIFAVPHDLGPWLKTADVTAQETAKKFAALDSSLTERQAKIVEEGVPTAHVVRIANASHFVYLSHQAEVLREMRAFINRL
jgi:pimeloyl-ACP methyl ester carboxylesterase